MTVGHCFRNARFLLAAQGLRDLPPDQGAEVVVAGRSNAGKSSVLNALCDQRGLARTSRTPGRTQQIVVFDLGREQRLLDLPGFGYSAVDRGLRASWARTLPRLLEERRALCGLLLVADVRLPLRAEERMLLQWAVAAQLPALLALNKCDKIGREAGLKALRAAQDGLRAEGIPAAAALVSALNKQGVDALRQQLQAWLEEGLKRGPGYYT
jgi:GTP-binding protein